MSLGNVFEVLNLRYQWEELVKDFKMEDSRKEGTIDNLEWFIENGMFNNRFRKTYKQARDLAYEIITKC